MSREYVLFSKLLAEDSRFDSCFSIGLKPPPSITAGSIPDVSYFVLDLGY